MVEELPGPGARLVLPEDQSHYLTRVCRARTGDRVSATDGRGALATLRILEGGRAAKLEVERWERIERAREAWVLCGPPEGERGDWMVEKLAELGVAVLQPVDCERADWERLKGRAERWRRLTVAALRQSRRRFLLEVREPLPLAEALEGLGEGGARWLGDAAGPPGTTITPAGSGRSIGLLGPAPGLSDREREAVAGHGFVAICLSDGRLRTETAALAWASWWSAAASGPSHDVAGRDRA